MGVPAIATCMKIFAVIHFAKILIEIKTKRGFLSIHLGGAGLLLAWFAERLCA